MIRPYEAKDEAEVCALWKTAFPDEPAYNESIDLIRRKLLVQPELFLVCVDSDRVVGTVMAGFDGVRGWVHKLAVLPELRRRGIARRLMEEAERRLATAGCPKLNLQIRSGNAEVAAFYASLGYAVEERISMGKRLSS